MIITGHKGFIGTELAKLYKSPIGLDMKDGKNIRTCYLPDDDFVIHLAAQSRVLPSIKDPEYDALNNIMGTIRMAQRYKDARFVFASSGGCIQEKIESPYGVSKWCAEEYIKLFVKDYVILRFPNIYGRPLSGSVVDKFLDGPIVINGDGTATRDYIHVEDIVRGIVMSSAWPSGTYHFGSGKYHSVLDLAKATDMEYTHGPSIDGEMQHTEIKNTAPDWKPEIDVIEYIKKGG